jgi:hypothetical protein
MTTSKQILLKYCGKEDLGIDFQKLPKNNFKNGSRRTKTKIILAKDRNFGKMIASWMNLLEI